MPLYVKLQAKSNFNVTKPGGSIFGSILHDVINEWLLRQTYRFNDSLELFLLAFVEKELADCGIEVILNSKHKLR